MAEPKKAQTAGGPMHVTRTIDVNADGSVIAGDMVKFAISVVGKIQFVAAAGLPEGVTAVFTPPLFGNTQTGVQPIYPNNAQNEPLGSNNQGSNGEVTSYMITGPGISQGPYCVTLGGTYMAISVDSAGNMTPATMRTPNSGLLNFNTQSAITFDVAWTGGGAGPFKSTKLALPQGPSVVHADSADCTVTLTPEGPVATPPSTVKIGSGGTGPLPKP
jgi:hypothetical protein